MRSTRLLRSVIVGCTLALLAAEPARAMMPAPRLLPKTPEKGPGPIPIPYPNMGPMGPLANQHLGNAQNALLVMARQLDEIATVKCDTDRSAVVAAWGTIVQTQRDTWSTEMLAALEAGKIHMKKQGKVDAAMIASLNTQIGAQMNFINSAFGTGGGMLAEWKLDFNQRMAQMAMMEKTMPVIFKHLTTDMDQVHQSLKDIQASLDRPETSPSTAQGLMERIDALKTRMDRVSRVVGIRQKVVEPYVKASAYPELKKKLDAILNIITPEQVAQNPSLSSIPAEVIQILQGWKTLLPKKCEDTYGPVWGSAQKAIGWVSDPNRLWNNLPFFSNAKTFGDADGLLTRAKAAAKEKLALMKARWSIAADITQQKTRGMQLREEVLGYRKTLATTDGATRSLLELVRKVKEAADKAEKAGAAFPEARKLIEEHALLIRERTALYLTWADTYSSSDGHEFDGLLAKVTQTPDKEAAAAIWADFRTKRSQKIKETGEFIRDNEDDIHKLIDEGNTLLTLMQ